MNAKQKHKGFNVANIIIIHKHNVKLLKYMILFKFHTCNTLLFVCFERSCTVGQSFMSRDEHLHRDSSDAFTSLFISVLNSVQFSFIYVVSNHRCVISRHLAEEGRDLRVLQRETQQFLSLANSWRWGGVRKTCLIRSKLQQKWTRGGRPSVSIIWV